MLVTIRNTTVIRCREAVLFSEVRYRRLDCNRCGLACSYKLPATTRIYNFYFAKLALSSCSEHDCDRIQAERVLYGGVEARLRGVLEPAELDPNCSCNFILWNLDLFQSSSNRAYPWYEVYNQSQCVFMHHTSMHSILY